MKFFDVFGSRLRLAAAAVVLASPAVSAPPGPLPFGVYDPPGMFSDDPEVTIEHIFLPWEDVLLSSLLDADAYALDRGRALLVTLEPWTWARDERNTPEYLKASIRSGLYDDNMRAICRVLNVLESPVTLRWAHEMDDSDGQFIWSGWEPDTYIAAYRRVIDICRTEAPGINFMWSPLGRETMAQYYPGDDYVDVIGLTVFGLQPYSRGTPGEGESFKEILAPRYLRASQFDKPIVVAELGYSGDEEYLARWDQEVRASHPEFPRLSGVVYFNQEEVYPWPDGFGYPDWRFGYRLIN